MGSTGASPFAAVASTMSAWSGWETQKPTTFESKPLFATSSSKPTQAPPPLPPRKEEYHPSKQESNDTKKPNKPSEDNEFSDDDEDVEYKYEDGDDEFWDADPESQKLENGDDAETPKKRNIDMRERFHLTLRGRANEGRSR